MSAKGLHVMMIGPGCGGKAEGSKYVYLKQKGFDCEVLNLPEATAGDLESKEKGMEMLKGRLAAAEGKILPDVIIGCSRGGKYVGELVNRNMWKGPMLLISAMGTRHCCESNTENIPLLLCHGTQDGTNPIHRVRMDVQQCQTAKLVEFDDDHSLRSLVHQDLLAGLVQQCYDMQFQAPSKPNVPKKPAR
eukprot:CAMPEP_0206202780 /NCGR_PEP_ID=MMETSP0166-20121206/12397_1 /ASSEMBLY_ACC=CAM_ASM_000260 /TAXON_ID=95228 /ORGANISM="Vannella robusta, Strain DIVA3 518/3/11/1/6" /LENGTH=189 /DNA_ID=CAMNT_0053621811 /DNA_START=606 /DNA_END=1172 /DNA_ORIENTATION=+